MNLPNSLTITRIFLVPVLAVVLLTRVENFEIWGVVIILGAALTDWLDGYFARRRQQVTTLGMMLDPIADKLLITAAFISLVELERAPAWMVVIILGREFAITGLRMIAAAEGFTVAVNDLGKAKMIAQIFAAALLILSIRYEALLIWGKGALWLVVLFALISAVQYFIRFWRNLDERVKERGRLFMLRQHKKQQDVRTQSG